VENVRNTGRVEGGLVNVVGKHCDRVSIGFWTCAMMEIVRSGCSRTEKDRTGWSCEGIMTRDKRDETVEPDRQRKGKTEDSLLNELVPEA
jgi:hypothetical protein